jgi:hypothetical protein
VAIGGIHQGKPRFLIGRFYGIEANQILNSLSRFERCSGFQKQGILSAESKGMFIEAQDSPLDFFPGDRALAVGPLRQLRYK